MTNNQPTHKVVHGASTDIGRARSVQEDSLLVSPPLFVVADGMGGHAAGDVASRMAVDVMSELIADGESALTEAVQRANQLIYEKAISDSHLAGMGTTITAMIAGDHSVQIAHVGDSRAYLLRKGELARLTEDHTVVDRLVRQGKLSPQEAAVHPHRSTLERALGVEDSVQVDVQALDPLPGDRLLLCTDGLSGLLDDEEIQEILTEVPDPAQAAKKLVAEALHAGGHDNVTALVVDYPGTPQISQNLIPEKPESKRRRRVWTALAIVAIILIAATLVARIVINGSWYVGEENGRVAIFKGVRESVAGVPLSKLEEESSIEVAELPDVYRAKVREGIDARTLEEARRIIRNIQSRASTPAPTPLPTPQDGVGY